MARLVLVAVAVASLMLEGSCQTSGTGIKLCGRDFVRTVIISCGGSRWKRHSPEENDEGGSFYSDLLDSLDDGPLLWSTEEPETSTPVSLVLHPHSYVQRDLMESSEDWEEEHGTRLSSAFPFPLEDKTLRFRRGAGMAKICCKRGCTRSEIIKLC
ncbi:relaxin-3-like [Leucoraja erinacea]|uniref:relaxin-3-like n=1 Tax=Leucoraja erinaceus TaxID=7782 RepID=UPI002458DF1F|nr:relaxin-3-like [Leucoraja erinacea]